MRFEPSEHLTDKEIDNGLQLVVKDGLAAEAMATLTGGAFLVALALKLGATNFQIGLLASLPTITNIFQLIGSYLISRIGNRRAVTVICSFFARVPLLLISLLPFLFSSNTSLNILIFFLFFHYFFGAISGCSWNSWMKDLVPESRLGTYFSNRSRLIQILNVVLSFSLAFILDYIKKKYPHMELITYAIMFLLGGSVGLYGVFILSKTPEPKIHPIKKNFFTLFKNPLKNVNFKNLLVFNAWWAFAINLAAPFFSVYMLKMLHLPLSYVVGFNILSQITNILFIRIWGRFSDRYSNKSIISICAPVYLCCILAWTFTTMPHEHFLSIPLLVIIYIFNGISVAGINLSMSNIGMKLAPKEGDAIVYLTTKGMVAAFFAGIAPVVGGLFADFFAERELAINLEWTSPTKQLIFHTLDLQQWDFFFALAVLLGLFALYRLNFVKEAGEVQNKVIVGELVSEFRREVSMNSSLATIKSQVFMPVFSLLDLVLQKEGEKFRVRKKNHGEASTFKDRFWNVIPTPVLINRTRKYSLSQEDKKTKK